MGREQHRGDRSHGAAWLWLTARRAICWRVMERNPDRTVGSHPPAALKHQMSADQEFLLYPIDTGEDPVCISCGKTMLIANYETREGKPDFINFRCEHCGRSEKFICEE
ncbi:hypothetical protein [Bradyrhizobium sp. McL0616]|uniref:hypothetical protein n=1 Tax=Bradyrhizobium sp. McL0616 TaxID=3415674 RepID=UPI003CF4E616